MDPEIEGDSGDTYKLIDDVVSMVEEIKKLPRTKFRNFLGKDLQIIMVKIEIVKKQRK